MSSRVFLGMSRRRHKAPSFDADANEKNRFIVFGAIAVVLVVGLILIFNGLFA